jgi:O-antigen ligase
VTEDRSPAPGALEAAYDRIRQLSMASFIVVLFVAPLPLASARDWSWSPLAVVVGFIALALSVGMMLPHRDNVPLASLIPAAVALVALVCWAFVQSGALPGVGSNSVVEEGLTALGRTGPRRVASDTEAAHTSAMLWLVYALSFWIAVEIARDARQARGLLVTIVCSGVVTTFYGYLAELAASLKGFWPGLVPKFGDDFSGTFVNRNHYATYVGLCILITLSLISFDNPRSSGPPQPLRLRLRRFAMRLSGTTGVYVAVLVVLAAGLVQSGSRGGLLSLLFGLVVFWMLGSRRPWLGLGVGVVVFGLLLSLPSAGTMLDRFAGLALGAVEHERIEVYGMALDAIALRPWTGWGLGSFAGVYSLLQPIDLANKFFDLAHNTYLELAVELGVPFGAVLPLIVLSIGGRCAVGLRERSRHRELPALAIAATALVGVHALVDFSIQMPAVALTFAAILGVGWAQSWSSRRDSS